MSLIRTHSVGFSKVRRTMFTNITPAEWEASCEETGEIISTTDLAFLMRIVSERMMEEEGTWTFKEVTP